jgi:hypothetical protein
MLAASRLADRVGFWVLMGCAENQSSFEVAAIDDGVLTYSLLDYMKEGSLPKGAVDVQNLFSYAEDKVLSLLSGFGISDSQRPQAIAPKADSFPLGVLTTDQQSQIPIAMLRPLVLRPELVALDTDIGLEKMLADRLEDQSESRGASSPSMTENSDIPNALAPRGEYSCSDDGLVKVTLILRRNKVKLSTVVMQGNKSDLAPLLDKLVLAINTAAENSK